MGWAGGVFSRVRNWVTDKANSVNPQAALFDQEDDNFASGLNNCITKDGLSKPTTAMDWNGQDLTNVKTLTQLSTGTVSLVGGKVTINSNGQLSIQTPTGNIDALDININSSSFSATGNPALRILNAASSGAQTPLDFFSNAVISGRIRNDSLGNMNYVSFSSGTHSFYVGGDSGVGTNTFTVTSLANGGAQVASPSGTLRGVGYRGIPQLTGSTSNYTFVLDDQDCMKPILNPATQWTIPANASVAYPVGTTLSGLNLTGGNATIAITSDTMTLAGTSTTGSRTIANNGAWTAFKFGSTNWIISGSGLS